MQYINFVLLDFWHVLYFWKTLKLFSLQVWCPAGKGQGKGGCVRATSVFIFCYFSRRIGSNFMTLYIIDLNGFTSIRWSQFDDLRFNRIMHLGASPPSYPSDDWTPRLVTSSFTGLTSNPSRLLKPPARSRESICFISVIFVTPYDLARPGRDGECIDTSTAPVS